MDIKHIVLSGGVNRGIFMLGVLKNLINKDIINIKNIESIYCVSIGSIIGTLLALKLDWDDIVNYFINKPWDKIEINNILLSIYDNKGILDNEFINMFLLTFMKYKNIHYDISLIDFYDITNIKLNIFSVELNNFKLVNFSHITHPNLKLLDAIYMSCSLPIMFKPNYYNDSYYIDGCLLNSYPVVNCINDNEISDFNEIMGIRIIDNNNDNKINKGDNILNFLSFLLNKMVKKIDIGDSKQCEIDLKYEIKIYCHDKNIDDIIELLKNKDFRIKCIEHGIKISDEFIEKL
tara:strand:- start:1118 stop:1990 length:873 start_codon:yes stop_codon:yes gene_type:complete